MKSIKKNSFHYQRPTYFTQDTSQFAGIGFNENCRLNYKKLSKLPNNDHEIIGQIKTIYKSMNKNQNIFGYS
jgi:hypothetical protein